MFYYKFNLLYEDFIWAGSKAVKKKNFKLNCDEKLFFLIVKTSFQQRRKILRNSLKSFGISLITKEDSIFEKRPEQLNVYDFVELTSIISNDTFSN